MFKQHPPRLLGILAVVTLMQSVTPVFAGTESNAAPTAQTAETTMNTMSTKASHPQLKGTVTNPASEGTGSSASGLPDPELLKHVEQWVKMDWSKNSASAEANPVLDGVAGNLPEEETRDMVRQMTSSEYVKMRNLLWRAWYQKLFTGLCHSLNTPPAGKMFFRVTVVISNDRKITALPDVTGRGEGSDGYAEKITDALNKLEGQAILAFPSEAKQKQVKFDLATTGFEQLQLFRIGPLD
jgi:hypothetical protein